MSADRTELDDLAASRPDVRDRLVKLWHDMAENVLLTPAKSRQPVAAEATPLVHPEWTDFSKEPEESAPRNHAAKKLPGAIRARK